MTTWNRRQFLQATGLVAGLAGSAGALAACTGSGSGSSGRSRDYLTWWDHQGNLKKQHQAIFDKFAKEPGGMRVRATNNPPAKMGQSLQLAKQSNQLPDVHTNAGLQIPAPVLIKDGWVAPLDLSDDAMKRLKPYLVDGIHVFDGKVYSFPHFNYRTYSTATWFNSDLIKKAGLDPDDPPKTYDDFRKAATAVRDKAGSNVFGWIWNLGQPERVGVQVDDLAQAAGFQGGGGMLYGTGEFRYHDDAYVNVIEFLLSMSKDKLIMGGSMSFSADISRTRWVSGTAGYFIDGPWNPGVIKSDFPAFADSLDVGPILVPEAGTEPQCYAAPQGGVYWLSPSAPAEQQQAANLLFSDHFTSKDYFTDLAGWMPMPPLDLSAVKRSSAYPSWKKLVGWMAKTVNLAPDPVVKNLDVTKVQAETKQIDPALGDIVQGIFTGEVTDIRKSLKDLSDKTSAERERAIKAAQQKGAKVSLEDYAFPNWQPGTDYSTSQYN